MATCRHASHFIHRLGNGIADDGEKRVYIYLSIVDQSTYLCANN